MAPHGYNLTQGGDGTFGRKHTEATKEKIKASNKKTWDNSPALKKAIGVKNALLKTGVPSPLKGKPNGRKGVPHSAEHAANLKAALNTIESKEKHSKALKLAFNDPAWKAAQSARVKAIWAIRKAQKETA
jgi:exo-beta-1,3-glucanase (GH17 family)